MTWADFYLICFLVGFTLSLISVLSGAFHLHLPGLHHIHGAHGSGSWSSSMFNLATITAFLAWFGGVGFLLSKFSGLWFWFAFSIAVGGGLTGSAIVFGFLFRVLLANEEPLNAIDYEMIGVLGRVSSTIRESGTGEIMFSQAGSRRSSPARSEDGDALPKGVDVLVTRYDRGIAYVRRFEDLNESNDATDAKEG